MLTKEKGQLNAFKRLLGAGTAPFKALVNIITRGKRG
jgi:hypothetical protein